jgi:hypothetical protein
VLLRLGRPEEAESNAHHTLHRLKPALLRNRAYYTAVLGLTQLRQGELELACATGANLGLSSGHGPDADRKSEKCS